MDEAIFEAKYKPIKNFLDSNASLDGTMFETYGEELDFVRKQPANTIWTYCDDGENGWLTSGYHLVNRLGYVVCQEPCDEDVDVPLYSLEDFA